MLSGPRMQSRYGSTEAINVNGTMISPLTTWDSKITTVLAMLGGVGEIVARGLKRETYAQQGAQPGDATAYDRFVRVVGREHDRVFKKGFVGDDVKFKLPGVAVPRDALSDWSNPCGV